MGLPITSLATLGMCIQKGNVEWRIPNINEEEVFVQSWNKQLNELRT